MTLQRRRRKALGDYGTGSNKRIGSTPASLSSRYPAPKSNAPLMAFRLIVIAIILFCVIWGYVIVKFLSHVNSSEGAWSEPHVAGPPPDGRSRIGWMIRQKLNSAELRMEMRLRPVPLADVARMDSPVLVITYNRADYLERALWKVFDHHPAQQGAEAARGDADLRGASSARSTRGTVGRLAGAPIIVSQDGSNAEVRAVVDTYRQLFEMRLGVPLYRIEHPRPPANASSYNWDTEWMLPYKLLAKHYSWALEQTFSGAAYDSYQKHSRRIPTPPLPKRVIILEEDVEIAIDFFSLMNATANLLDSDDTLLAVSAFNDNGKEQFVANAKRLVRSDFFPGLGWMMSRNVWEGPSSHPDAGLKIDWAPDGFWDDWLRESARRRGRHVIRPEISRTFHFGNIHGASEGENNKNLNAIELEQNNIRWEDQDLSYLDASRFAKKYWIRASSARLVETTGEAKSFVSESDVRIVYAHFKQFRQLASELEAMEDEKAGIPRTAYEGIVEVRYGRGDFFIYLTPPYINATGKPSQFGMKAWEEYSKESLMQELGIKNDPIEDYYNRSDHNNWSDPYNWSDAYGW